MKTKLLTPKQYPTKLWSREDIIKDLVNREAEVMVPNRKGELRSDTRPKFKLTKVSTLAFAREVISILTP